MLRSPYMLLVAPLLPTRRRELSAAEGKVTGVERVHLIRSDIPAVTHLDYSARLQTVSADINPLYHQLISRFKALTGYGLVVNTSFNVRDEPIVCTPQQALNCFMTTAMDELYIGSYRLQKPAQ